MGKGEPSLGKGGRRYHYFVPPRNGSKKGIRSHTSLVKMYREGGEGGRGCTAGRQETALPSSGP